MASMWSLVVELKPSHNGFATGWVWAGRAQAGSHLMAAAMDLKHEWWVFRQLFTQGLRGGMVAPQAGAGGLVRSGTR